MPANNQHRSNRFSLPQAPPEPRWRRVGDTVSDNRGPVVVAAAIILALLVVTIALTVPNHRNLAAGVDARSTPYGWYPPHNHTVDGVNYPLFNSFSVVDSVKTSTANWVDAAWCDPIAGKTTPAQANTTVAGLFSPDTQGRFFTTAGQLHQRDNLIDVAATVPDGARVSGPFCAWFGNYPRVTTTGGTVAPSGSTYRVLLYPANYGRLVQANVPVVLEVSYRWTLGSRSGTVHDWVDTTLVYSPGTDPSTPRLTNAVVNYYKLGTNEVDTPAWTPGGVRYHWNYGGQPVGAGFGYPPNNTAGPGVLNGTPGGDSSSVATPTAGGIQP